MPDYHIAKVSTVELSLGADGARFETCIFTKDDREVIESYQDLYSAVHGHERALAILMGRFNKVNYFYTPTTLKICSLKIS